MSSLASPVNTAAPPHPSGARTEYSRTRTSSAYVASWPPPVGAAALTDSSSSSRNCCSTAPADRTAGTPCCLLSTLWTDAAVSQSVRPPLFVATVTAWIRSARRAAQARRSAAACVPRPLSAGVCGGRPPAGPTHNGTRPRTLTVVLLQRLLGRLLPVHAYHTTVHLQLPRPGEQRRPVPRLPATGGLQAAFRARRLGRALAAAAAAGATAAPARGLPAPLAPVVLIVQATASPLAAHGGGGSAARCGSPCRGPAWPRRLSSAWRRQGAAAAPATVRCHSTARDPRARPGRNFTPARSIRRRWRATARSLVTRATRAHFGRRP